MLPTTTHPADSLAHSTLEFEQFMLKNKFVWDNATQVGSTVPRHTIQHSTTPPPYTMMAGLSIQHRQSTLNDAIGIPADSEAKADADRKEDVKVEVEVEPTLSPRLTFIQLVTSDAAIEMLPAALSILSNSNASSSSSSSWSSPSTTPPASPILPSTSDLVLFTTEYFEARNSENKGYGAFATKDIEAGTLIIAEKPLFKAEMVEIYAKYEGLTREERVEYSKLCYWRKLDQQVIIARFMTNRFEITSKTGGIFIKCSRFNHTCPPYKSCTYLYNSVLDQLEVRAHREIKKGEEITISYTSQPSTLYGNYGFHCDCPQCKGLHKAKKMRILPTANDEPWVKRGGVSFGDDGSGLADIMYRHYRTFG